MIELLAQIFLPVIRKLVTTVFDVLKKKAVEALEHELATNGVDEIKDEDLPKIKQRTKDAISHFERRKKKATRSGNHTEAQQIHRRIEFLQETHTAISGKLSRL